jgi:APA family basic amino acid/polyamine antiporter
VFAELSARLPGHGGIFRYIHAAFGRLPAFVYGWANWLVIQAGAMAVVALICIDNIELAAFGTSTSAPHLRVMFGALLILLLTGTNLLGLRVGKRVQNLLTVIKVLAICLLVAVAMFATGTPPADAVALPAGLPEHPLARFAGAMLPVLFAIGGWQQGSFVAGAARRPQRDVPLGILGGVAVVVVVYMAINVAYIDLLGFHGAAASKAIGADAARSALGPSGGRVFAAMVAVSAAGIMNTICLAPPYVLLTMAEAGLFPRAFARRHGEHGTPWVGVLAQGLWATVLLLAVHGIAVFCAGSAAAAGEQTLATLGFLCDGVVFVDWVFFTLCSLALLRLRRGGGRVPFQVPGGPWLAVVFGLGAAAVACGAIASNPQASLTGAAIVALGVPAAALLRRRSAAAG